LTYGNENPASPSALATLRASTANETRAAEPTFVDVDVDVEATP
jgi:hypothetical protein